MANLATIWSAMESFSLVLDSPLYLKIALALLGALAFAFYWFRAGSINNLLDRLWRLIVGNADVHDTRLKAYMEEVHDLEKFRFIYGIRVNSMVKLHRFMNWQKENNVSIARAQKIRRWIDTDAEDMLVQPPRSYVYTKFALFLVSLAIFGLAMFLMNYSSALLAIKSTKTHFIAERDQVRSTLGQWIVKKDECASQSNSKPQDILTQEERGVLCELLSSDELSSYLEKTIKKQKNVGIALLIFSSILLIYALQCLAAAAATVDLIRHLAARSPTEADG